MNRRELVKAVAAHLDADTKTVDEVMRGFTDVVTAVVSKGEPVAISGFAKFAKVERPARMGRNPATGEAIKIKASKKARITALKGFKDSVMTPSQAPKLARGVWPPAPAATATKTTTRAAAKPATSRAAAKPAAGRKATTKATSAKTTPARAAAKRTTTRGAAKATTGARSTTTRRTTATAKRGR